jgi:hypothetical protein
MSKIVCSFADVLCAAEDSDKSPWADLIILNQHAVAQAAAGYFIVTEHQASQE